MLQRLVDTGNTVLVIEHNLDVIKQADWIVDLGPEGGEAGGEIVASARPRTSLRSRSYTGRFLRPLLERMPSPPRSPSPDPSQSRTVLHRAGRRVTVLFAAGVLAGYLMRRHTICKDGKPPWHSGTPARAGRVPLPQRADRHAQLVRLGTLRQ